MSSQPKTAIVGSACGRWSVRFVWKVMPDGRLMSNRVTVSVRHLDVVTGRLNPVKGDMFDGIAFPNEENHFTRGDAIDLWHGIRQFWGDEWKRLA